MPVFAGLIFTGILAIILGALALAAGFMLKGKMDYRHGKQVYGLKVGDSLSFEGNVPHGPERLLQVPIQFLAIIHYDDAE